MSNELLMYLMIGVVALFGVVIIAYVMISKKMQSSEIRQIRQLREGTEKSSLSLDIVYQKLYIAYTKIPLVKRYLLKLR